MNVTSSVLFVHRVLNTNYLITAVALPQIELFESLNQLITTYPSNSLLRESLITHLDTLLRSTLPFHPRAITILYTRLLTSTADTASQASSSSANVEALRGQALIEGIRRANEMLISLVSQTQEESVRTVYAQFTLDWCCGQNSVISLDENLVSGSPNSHLPKHTDLCVVAAFDFHVHSMSLDANRNCFTEALSSIIFAGTHTPTKVRLSIPIVCPYQAGN